MIISKNQNGKWWKLDEYDKTICNVCKKKTKVYHNSKRESEMTANICFDCRKLGNMIEGEKHSNSREIKEVTEEEWDAYQVVQNL